MAILVFGAIACLTIVPGQADFLGKIYAFGAMLSFTIAHVSVCVLRAKAPDVERPYRIPGGIRVRGSELPLLSVIGGLSTGVAFVVLSVLNIEVLVSGVVWLALGLTGYVLYRRNQGLSLTETKKVKMLEPIVDHEVEYQSVLVAFEDGAYSAEAIGTAVKLAARRRRGIHVLVTVDGARQRSDRRDDAGGGSQGPGGDRLGSGAGWAARDRARGEGARRGGREADRERGAGDRGRRDRDGASAAPDRQLASSVARSRRCWPSGRVG